MNKLNCLRRLNMLDNLNMAANYRRAVAVNRTFAKEARKLISWARSDRQHAQRCGWRLP